LFYELKNLYYLEVIGTCQAVIFHSSSVSRENPENQQILILLVFTLFNQDEKKRIMDSIRSWNSLDLMTNIQNLENHDVLFGDWENMKDIVDQEKTLILTMRV
jgi:hypothetical protein